MSLLSCCLHPRLILSPAGVLDMRCKEYLRLFCILVMFVCVCVCVCVCIYIYIYKYLCIYPYASPNSVPLFQFHCWKQSPPVASYTVVRHFEFSPIGFIFYFIFIPSITCWTIQLKKQDVSDRTYQINIDISSVKAVFIVSLILMFFFFFIFFWNHSVVVFVFIKNDNKSILWNMHKDLWTIKCLFFFCSL